MNNFIAHIALIGSTALVACMIGGAALFLGQGF